MVLEVPAGIWPVTGDAIQMHQALMNICLNARDALPDGGIHGERRFPKSGHVCGHEPERLKGPGVWPFLAGGRQVGRHESAPGHALGLEIGQFSGLESQRSFVPMARVAKNGLPWGPFRANARWASPFRGRCPRLGLDEAFGPDASRDVCR